MNIRDYLPENGDEATGTAQGKVEKGLLTRTRMRMKVDNITWDEFLTAACQAYLEEPIPKRKVVK